MASKIKNVVETTFTSKGAGRVEKETQSIGRAQTRLGQESASAGRQFAAQSTGLGGLVAAYAGAAATIFALGSAFEALNRAAAIENAVKSTQALAAAVGQSAPRILEDLNKITQGQLTLEQTTQALNVALATGFSSDQIRALGQAAASSAQALGRDLNDSLKRVFKGAAELNTNVLKQVGIFVRVDTAVAKYAASIGKSAKELSEFERRQALVNAITEESNKKFSALGSDAESAQVALARLQAQLKDLGQGFVLTIANALTPFVNFLSNNTGATLLAFAGLAALVFGKATQIISAFTTRSLESFALFSDKLADSFKIDDKIFKDLQTQLKKFRGEDGLKGLKLSPVRGQDVEQFERFKLALEGQRAGQVATLSALNQTNKAYKEQLRFLEKTGKTGTLTYTALKATIDRNNEALKTGNLKTDLSIKSTNILRGAINGLTIAVKFLGVVLRAAFAIITVLQIAGSLFDVDLLGKVKNAILGITQATKDAAAGFKGLTAAAVGGGAALTAEFRLLGLADEEIAKIPEQVEKLQQEIIGRIRLSSVRFKDIADIPLSAVVKDIEKRIQEQQAILAKPVAETRIGAFLAGSKKISEEARKEAELTLKLLQLLETRIQTFGGGVQQVVGQLARQTGLTEEAIGKIFAENQVAIFNTELSKVGNELLIFGQKLERTGDLDSFDLSKLDAESRKFVESLLLAISTLNSAEQAFRNNEATAESLGKQIVGITERLKEARAIGDIPVIADLEERLESLRTKQRFLQDITDTLSRLESTFGADIRILDTALWNGLISASGKFATNQSEIAKNQVSILKATLDTFAVDKGRQNFLQRSIELLEEQKDLNAFQKTLLEANKEELAEILAEILAKSELYEKTLEATAGRLFQINTSVIKIRKEQEKVLEQKQKELELLNQQNAIEEKRLQNQLATAIRENALAAEENNLKILRAQLSTDEKRLEIIKSQVDAAIRLAQIDRAADPTAVAARRAAIGGEVATTIEGITSEPIREAAAAYKAAIQEASTASAATITAAQKLVLEAEEQVKRAIINEQLTLFDAETRLQRDKTTAELFKLQNEAQLLEEQAKLDKARLESQKALIDAEIEVTKAQLEGYQNFVAGVNGFRNATEELARILNSFLDALPGVDASIPIQPLSPISVEANTLIARSALNLAAAKSKEIIDAQITAIQRALDLNVRLIRERQQALIKEEIASGKIRAAERAALELELAAASIEANNAIAELTRATGGAADQLSEDAERLKQILTSIFEGIRGAIETSLIGVKNFILFGEGNLQDIFVQLLRSIGDTILEEGFIKPISERLAGSLFGSLTGIPGGRSGIDEAFKLRGSSPANPVFVSTGDGPLGRLLSPQPDGDQERGTGGFFQTIIDFITKPFTALFGADGFLTNLISGFGNIVGNIFTGILKFITSIFGFAAGGMVHRAGGGAIPQLASGGGLRDRVPALLEPGEFVLRRAAANKIGISNLQQMNATGQTPSAAPIINFTNEGTAKTAETSQPRFDGERYVIDIVTRDLQNNGPIRKSLRGGL